MVVRDEMLRAAQSSRLRQAQPVLLMTIIGCCWQLCGTPWSARYCYAMSSSPLVQTLIGGGLAIVAGFIAAWWQTSRADNVARRIRQTERREQALLELDALASGLEARLEDLFRQVEHGQTPWQYQEALRVFGELQQHWRSKSSGVIPDPEIVSAYNAVVVAVDRLPTGAGFASFMSNLQAGDPGTVQGFVGDLAYVLGKLGELRKVVHDQVVSLLPHEPWLRRVAARALVPLRRRQRTPGELQKQAPPS